MGDKIISNTRIKNEAVIVAIKGVLLIVHIKGFKYFGKHSGHRVFEKYWEHKEIYNSQLYKALQEK